MSLQNLIRKAQLGDEVSLIELITSFENLLKKYARLLECYYDYDYAYSDLEFIFIKVIYKIPIEKDINMQNEYCILNYIKKSIHRAFISLKHKYIKIKNKEICEDEDKIIYMAGCIEKPIYEEIFIKELLDRLSHLQKKVIKDIFINDIPEKELARRMNVSKQAINRIKMRALNNLRNELREG